MTRERSAEFAIQGNGFGVTDGGVDSFFDKQSSLP